MLQLATIKSFKCILDRLSIVSYNSLFFCDSSGFSVFSNLTRFVVIIWVFVVLILIQSYTASLASLLTVEQLQPTIRDVKELIRSGETVGYQQGSFVKQLLIQMGFNGSKLKSYNATHYLDELMTKGTEGGGISAAFDELPYVKVFLAEYCSKYTMVPPTYKADGFGFVSLFSLSFIFFVCLSLTGFHMCLDAPRLVGFPKRFSSRIRCLPQSANCDRRRRNDNY